MVIEFFSPTVFYILIDWVLLYFKLIKVHSKFAIAYLLVNYIALWPNLFLSRFHILNLKVVVGDVIWVSCVHNHLFFSKKPTSLINCPKYHRIHTKAFRTINETNAWNSFRFFVTLKLLEIFLVENASLYSIVLNLF